MKTWRPSRQRSSKNQPDLPGLLEQQGHKSKLRPISPHERSLDHAKLRLTVVLLAFGIIYSIIGWRLINLAFFSETHEPPQLHALPKEQTASRRADITDRNGEIIATSLPTVSLCADAKSIINPDEAGEKLRSVLPELDRKKLMQNMEGGRRCAVIKRHLTPRQYAAINKMGIAGLEFLPDETRIYPVGRLTSHVVGYTDIDNNGIAGMEKSLNDRLENQNVPVALSVDLRLQAILHRELEKAVDEFKAIGAAGLIMDADTGEILAMVSLPDFDPQRAGQASDDSKFNRASLGVYEMGSTFKTFTIAMALDSGLIKPSDRFDTTHPIQISGKTIRDFHPVQYPLNVAEIYMESSNIGAAKIADKIGTARQRAFLSSLGLTEKGPLELPETGSPLVPSPQNWNKLTTMTVAFGHGIAVNAVQMAAAFASIVNGGILIRPTLLKVMDTKNKNDKPENKIISEQTAAQMRALMRLVVRKGTAKSADIAGYMVGGKTGTADKLSGGQYNKNARISSFIGAFPVNSPRYIVLVMLDDPKGNPKTYGFATGGWTAAPTVGRVISQMGPLLNIPPQNPEEMASAEKKLLRVLGSQIMDSLETIAEKDDYASVESNTPE